MQIFKALKKKKTLKTLDKSPNKLDPPHVESCGRLHLFLECVVWQLGIIGSSYWIIYRFCKFLWITLNVWKCFNLFQFPKEYKELAWCFFLFSPAQIAYVAYKMYDVSSYYVFLFIFFVHPCGLLVAHITKSH